MYRAISELLLDGVQYRPGQVVDMSGVDARVITRLLEQRRILFAPQPASEPKRKPA